MEGKKRETGKNEEGTLAPMLRDANAAKLVEIAKKMKAEAKTPQDYEKLAGLYRQIEELYEGKKELNPFFAAQYEEQVEVLESVGFLEEEPDTSEMGIACIDNKFYPLPTKKEIAGRLEKNRAFIERKKEQGFKKLLLVPFGKSLEGLFAAYASTISNYSREDKLFAPPAFPGASWVKLEENAQGKPVWLGDRFAINTYALTYYPKRFSGINGGKTKKEILEKEGGWNILLLEDMPNIPRLEKFQILGGRQQLDAGWSPHEYLDALQNTKPGSAYEGEVGLTPEDYIMYAITHLEEKNEVIDDYLGNGRMCYLLGAYYAAGNRLPLAYWDRNRGQAIFDETEPFSVAAIRGTRTVIKI